MATALVNDADIQAIRPTGVDTAVFIQAAAILQETYLGEAGLSTELLTEIQRWWTAHLMEVAAQTVVERKLGDTSLSYERGKIGEGLRATRFGQQVLALDPTGALANTIAMRQGRLQTFGV